MSFLTDDLINAIMDHEFAIVDGKEPGSNVSLLWIGLFWTQIENERIMNKNSDTKDNGKVNTGAGYRLPA